MKSIFVLSGAAMLAIAGPVWAEQTFSNNGTGTAQSTSTTHAIAEGHVLIETSSVYSDLSTDDPNNPLNGATGPCFGSMEFKGGVLSGGGKCVYSDKDGDMAVMDWTAEKMGKGGPEGSWMLTGGSGKYIGGSGGGTYAVMTDPGDGSQVNTVSGEFTLK